MKRQYARHLPHQIPEGFPIFVTWNLKGSLPEQIVARLRSEKARLEQAPSRIGESLRDRRTREGKIVFALADQFLDSTTSGPMHLKDERAAKIVEDSILFGVDDRYELFAWCVMANHVHLLITPVIAFPKVMQGIKGFTSHEINALFGSRGETFWQDESFDHWARDDDELIRIVHYIENNPVKAGLCEHAHDWRWSSARFRATFVWPAGTAFRPEWLRQ